MRFLKIAFAVALLCATTPALAAQRSFAPLDAPSASWAATATQGSPLSALRAAAGAMLGRLPDSVPMHIVVGLAMRDRAGAASLMRRQYTAGDPMFKQFLTPAAFTARYNPTRAQAIAVATYLQRQGFTNIEIEPNNLLVSGTAAASRVGAAFHTQILMTYAAGRVYYGNVTPAQVPSPLRGLVVAVLGLSNLDQMRTHLHVDHRFPAARPSVVQNLPQPEAANTPPPCLEVLPNNNECVGGVYGPLQYQSAYDACAKACTGFNTTVAVMAEGNVTQVKTDLRYAEAYWDLPVVPYTVEKVGVSSIDTSGLDEWDLDTQSSTGIADKVKHLYVYDTTTLTDSDITLEYNHWANDDLAQAGNSSFGEPESSAYADGSMLVDDEILNQAASQGQTMFASTSDSGEGCSTLVATGVPVTGTPEPCYPASSPYVVAVGGTTLDTIYPGYTYYGEHAWVATGGGVSAFETAPYWQANGIVPTATAGRSIADISMCSDNNGCPMYVFVDEPSAEEVGGTSLGSPLSMGVWARMETANHNDLGFAAPVYYGVYGYYEPCPLGSTGCIPAAFTPPPPAPPDGTEYVGGFHDILYGNNGGPPTLPGWDTATGLGSIDICVMQADIRNSIFSGH
jgi:pseudomonalisin